MEIRNWQKFQHYSRRNPPWIKLYRDLLNDPQWFVLDPLAAKALISLWLLAAETDGKLPAIDVIAFRLRLDSKVIAKVISSLNHWIIFDDSNVLATCYQHAIPETERETEKRKSIVRKYSDEFLEFWSTYPNKTGKGGAWKVWQTQQPDLAAVLAALAWQKINVNWTKEGGKYVPMPSTYLNQRRWEDEPAEPAKATIGVF